MRLAIDLQGAQSESRFRGIGRYSMSLTKAICEKAKDIEILVLLNGSLSDSLPELIAEINKFLPSSQIRIWHSVTPSSLLDETNKHRNAVSSTLFSQFVDQQAADVLLISSLFEGYLDESCTVLEGINTPTVAIHYDLIPLTHKRQYLDPNPGYKAFYHEKLNQLNTAHHLLAISEHTKKEAQDLLEIPESKITNISAAADAIFHCHADEKSDAKILDSLNVTTPYILYTGGADSRKNLPTLLDAMTLLSQRSESTLKLVIAGKFPVSEQTKLQSQFDQADTTKLILRFLGFVSDEQLACLYRQCCVFVFPSVCEGFGLPVLEALSCGAPTIASNTSSIPEVLENPQALFDPYDPSEIAALIDKAINDKEYGQSLKIQGESQAARFSWERSAELALRAIGELNVDSPESVDPPAATDALKSVISLSNFSRLSLQDLAQTAKALSANAPLTRKPTLHMDISELVNRDARSGIQRVVRNILAEITASPPEGYEVRAVYAGLDGLGYRYASSFMKSFLRIHYPESNNSVADIRKDDLFLGLDLQHHVVQTQIRALEAIRNRGAKVYFVVYDLLPVLLSDCFPHGTADIHQTWLETISEFDGVICISQAVADEYRKWLDTEKPNRNNRVDIRWFHLGSDLQVEQKRADEGQHKELQLPKEITARITFLMVGTLEPRKGHHQALRAFEALWQRNIDINLVIIGKAGWKTDKLAQKIREHPETGQRLFWLESASDQELQGLYDASSCLLMASEGEGFGLPLIEAAQAGLPIICRDLPVFREIAEGAAYFFPNDKKPASIAKAVYYWMAKFKKQEVANPAEMQIISWAQSAQQISNIMTSIQRR